MNTGAYTSRINYLNQLVSFKPAAGDQAMGAAMAGQAAGQAIGDPAMFASPAGHLASPETWVMGAKNSDPLSVCERVLDTVVQDDETMQQQQHILHYIATDGVGNRVTLSGENYEEKVRGAVSLAMTLPSYQLA